MPEAIKNSGRKKIVFRDGATVIRKSSRVSVLEVIAPV
jgi:hypothetical protein